VIEEPIGSPSGNAPNEAAEPTRRVTAPGTMIAPDHDPAGGSGATDEAAKDQAATEQATTAQAPTEQATTAQAPTEQATTAQAPTEQVAAERTADRVAGGGTDADPSGTDRARTNGGAEPPTAADSGTDRRGKRLSYAKTVAGVLIAYAALRGLCMAFVLTWGYRDGITPVHLFDRFDMSGYIHIAMFGYDKALTYGPDGVPQTTNLAFFPLYPGMIRAVVGISPLSYISAGLFVAWLSSLAAAWGLFAVASQLYNRRVGVLLVVLWAVLPYAIDESLGLTESLFTALAAWCFYALLKRRWLTAGVLCMISGLSRPTAVALMAAVGVAALIALYRREKPWWRPVVATAITPLGWIAYLVWVGRRLHRSDGWFYVQDKAWRSSFDGGRYSFHMAVETLRGHEKTIEPYVVTLTLVVIVVLFVLSILERQPASMIVYSALLFITTVGGTNYYHTDPRHLLPAFPLLLPVAVGASRMRVRNVAALVIVMTAIAAWYGGWLAIVWGFSY
jgi:hypothetical protein